jgi:hypothetical protein
LDRLIEAGVKGGQFADGSQKDGILQYTKGRPSGVYDPQSGSYHPIPELAETCDKVLGSAPEGLLPWKMMLGHPQKDDLLKTVFANMLVQNTLGADLARRYGQRSCAIGRKLVSDGVALNDDDVNTVLLTGFYHVYGPINNYFGE